MSPADPARRLPRAAALLALAALAASCGGREGVEAGALTLSAAPPDAPMRAGYLTLTNHGPESRTLTSARSDAYEIVEFHVTEIVDGVARMREERDLTLAPGDTLSFEPLGRHLMLMRPTGRTGTGPLVIELCFADGECIAVSTADPASR